jgi:Protein phosphatase 2C
MTLTTDHTFHIGLQHLQTGKPCQDFALSGTLSDNLVYAIVSDGCSSGGMTDIGARLMVLATKRAIIDTVPVLETKDWYTTISRITTARNQYLATYRDELGLQNADLLATCLFAIGTPDFVVGHVTGDGVIAVVYEHDSIIEEFSWQKNTPYYPAYAISDQNVSFKHTHEDSAEPFAHMCTWMKMRGQGGTIEGTLDRLSVERGMEGIFFAHSHSEENFYPGRLISVALMTDGVTQIDGVDVMEASEKLTAWKSTQGQFAVRRMNRFLAEAKTVGKGPQDDIAQAVIHLGIPIT